MKHTPIQLRHLFPLLKVFLLLALPIYANVPSEINYRGQLLDNAGNPVSGTVSAEVKVYDSQSAGTLLYSESIGNIQVKNGTYAFKFGSASTPNLLNIIPTASESWLEVIINGGALNRQLLVSVPYAMVAQSLGDGSSAEINGAISLSPQSTPPQAQDGKVALYAKPDGKLYIQGLDGEEKEVSGGGGFISDSPEGSRSIIAVPIGSSVPPEYNFYQHASYDQNASWEYLGEISTKPTSAGDKNNELFPSVLAGTEIHFFGYDNGTKFHKIFDTSNDQWSVGNNSFDTPESNRPIIASLNGKIYKFNSIKGDSYSVTPGISQVYDVSTKNWSNITSAPTAHSSGAAAVFEGKIVIFFWGGNTTSANNYDSYTCIYDPQTGSWTTDNNHALRYDYGGDPLAEVIDNELWVVNGRSQYYFNLHNFKNSFQNQKVIGFDDRYVNPAGIFKYRNSIFIPSTSGYMTRYLPEKNSFSLLEKFPAPGHIRVHFVNNKIFSLRQNSSSNKYELYRLDLDETFKNLYDLYAIPGNSSANANSGTSSSGAPSIIRVSNEEKAPSGYTQIKQESIEWSMVSKSNPVGDVSIQGDLFSINGKLYYDYGAVKYFEENASVWKVLTHSSGGGSKSGKTAIGSKIYYVGGISDGKKFQVFDTVTATTTEGPAIPYAMWEPCVESVNGKIYAFGSRATQYSNDNNKYVLEFDINSNTWTRLTDKILSINAESLVLDDKIYVIGGGNPSSQSRNFFKYSPENDSWESLPSLPVGLLQHSVFTIGGSIYAFGGPGEFFKFSFNEKQWLILRDHPFPNDTFYSLNHSVTIHNGNLWLTGGGRKRNINSNDNYPQAVETYVGELRESLFIKNSENSTSTSTGSSSSTTNNYPANLFMPYGTNGEPVFATRSFTVPDGKVLITSNFSGFIKVGDYFVNASSHRSDYLFTQDVVIIGGNTSFTIHITDSVTGGGFAGMLFNESDKYEPIAGGTNYTVPVGKKLFITSAHSGLTLDGVYATSRRGPIGRIPIVVPSQTVVSIFKDGPYTNIDTPAGFSGYLMDE